MHRILVEMELPVLQFYALLKAKRLYTDAQLDQLSRHQPPISFDPQQCRQFNEYFKRKPYT